MVTRFIINCIQLYHVKSSGGLYFDVYSTLTFRSNHCDNPVTINVLFKSVFVQLFDELKRFVKITSYSSFYYFYNALKFYFCNEIAWWLCIPNVYSITFPSSIFIYTTIVSYTLYVSNIFLFLLIELVSFFGSNSYIYTVYFKLHSMSFLPTSVKRFKGNIIFFSWQMETQQSMWQ